MNRATAGRMKVGRIASPQQVPDYADVVISSAQLLALNATPQPLVAAPGVGYYLELYASIVRLAYNSIAYNGIAAGEDLSIKYTDASGLEVGSLETTGFLDATAIAVRHVPPKLTAGFTPVENAALVLHLLTGEVATGNSPLRIRTYFHRLPFTF